MIERTEGELKQLIHKEMQLGIEQGQVVDAVYLTHRVTAAMGAIPEELPGADWLTLCQYGYTRRLVGSVLRVFKEAEEEHSEQLLMPGFQHLQKAYLTTRDGRQVIVPLPLLTDEEIDAKCEQMIGMEKGLAKHREELQRYKDSR